MSQQVQSVVSDAKELSRDLWSDGRGWILLCISAGWFIAHGVRTAFPALVPFLQADFEIGLSVIGVLLTALWVSYALGQLPGGVLGDKIGEGNILVVSLALSALAVFIVSVSTSFGMLFVGTITFGLATALYAPARFTIFTDIYDRRDGSAIGISLAAGSLGDMTVPVVAAMIATAFIWRWSFGWTLPVFVILSIATWIIVPSRTSDSTSAIDGISRRTIFVIKDGIFYGSIPTMLVINIFLSFVSYGLYSFYPTYLVHVKGFSSSVAATLYALFYAVAFAVQPLTGILKDALGTRMALMTILAVLSFGLWILPFANSLVFIVFVTVTLSTVRGFPVITQTFYANELPDYMRGTGLGVIRTGTILLGAISPMWIGVLGEFGLFVEAYMVLAACATIGFVITLIKL